VLKMLKRLARMDPTCIGELTQYYEKAKGEG
jgi:hypothetical protein